MVDITFLFLIKLESKKSKTKVSGEYDGCLIIDITVSFECFLTLSIWLLLIIKIKILVLSLN